MVEPSIDQLVSWHKRDECCGGLASLDRHERYGLFYGLTAERLERKSGEILRTFIRTNNDWVNTLYITLFRFLGGSHNREVFETLAHVVTHNIIMRENNSLRSVEALLFGASGLLSLCGGDDYCEQLSRDFEHLSVKYDIRPMRVEDWKLSGMYIHNHPMLRIAQIAACLHKNSITMQSIASCKTYRDVRNLFSAEASEYWATGTFYSRGGQRMSRRIGRTKSDIMGINFVVPMMYAYGLYTHNHVLVEQSMILLGNIPAEDNHYIKYWNGGAVIAESAIDSQAMIQLSREYCERGRCKDCPLGCKLSR